MGILKNGTPWFDTDGNLLHAHGGHMLWHDGYYYWYGENRNGDRYVSCYRSRDLQSFEYRGDILTTTTPTKPIRVRTDLSLTGKDADGNLLKVNLERPKVLYCERTKKFVLWVHFENGKNYHDARCAIATSDYPDRDFTYHGSFNPFGSMARDCTLFLDDDGKAYFLAASRDNADLHVWRLTPDFLNTERLVNVLWQGEYREAPALFKRNGVYYLLSSFCTGWAPNQGKWSRADAIDGDWTMLEDFGDATTFHSQPAFVLKRGEQYLYIADRWGGDGHYNDSTYLALEIKFREDGSPFIDDDANAAL